MRKRVSGSCLKNVAQLPHHDEHPRHCFVCSVPSDRCCVACSHPVCHDCSHKTLCTRCVFNVDGKSSCPNVSSSLVESDCVPAEVNIVEEEHNMATNQERNDMSAGRRSALLLSSQRVKPHFLVGINQQQIRIRILSSQNFFFERFEFLVCSCECAVACLCPRNSISNVVASVTIHANIYIYIYTIGAKR